MKLRTTKTRGADRVLVDYVDQTPVEAALAKRWRRVLLTLVVLLLLLLVAGIVRRVLRDRPVTYQAEDEHFRYGSIGAEPGGSLLAPVGGMLPPYQIFAVLPDMFPDKLPGGYAELGLIYEKKSKGELRDLPIGVSRRFRLGMDLVGLNCAVCHVGTLRVRPDAERQVVLGMPAHQLDLQGFFSFVLSSVLDSRFTADNVAGHIERRFGPQSAVDRLLLRAAVVAQVRERTLQLQNRVGLLFAPNAPQWGPGRVDTFNPYKALQFNWQLDRLPPREIAAASDFPALWNQAPREGMNLHWDGNNSSLDERNLSAGLGAGITAVTADHPAIARVKQFILSLPPPRWPESQGMPLDHAASARGQKTYAKYCASCHDFGAPGVGQVVPLAEIGTDPARFNSYTPAFADNQNTLFASTPHHFHHFRKTVGYSSQPLDGIWARAPYLHNGSVPTLADLLEPPEKRPKQFYRGCDVYDAAKAGFVSTVEKEGNHRYFRFDTTQPGNSNSGHTGAAYGTDLPPAEKHELVEYLKTL